VEKIKLWGGITAAVLFLIVVFQNTDEVQVKILFEVISMPRAVLLFCCGLVGFLAGALFQRHRAKKKA